MAGIGFDLLKLLKKGSYQSLINAYGVTALFGSGPGLFIIIGIGIVCFFNVFTIPDPIIAKQFLVIVIYLFSSSMIMTSFLQYTFFRFMADKIFTSDFEELSPNLIGVLWVQFMMCVCVSLPIVFYFFKEESLILKILMIANFIILSLIWISTVLLAGLKAYRGVLLAFFMGYAVMLIVHFLVDNNEIYFLLFEFLLAQAILFVVLLHAILDEYPTKSLMKVGFIKKNNVYFTLIFSNFFYTLGIWIDKYLFWFNPDTSYEVFSPLRASPLYDVPMFFAYISIIPATAAFLFQVETNFSMVFPKFMKTIFRKKTLIEINTILNELTIAGRKSMNHLFKTQYVVTISVILLAPYVCSVFNILSLHLSLLYILVIAGGLNVILWGLLNILYYMTRYFEAFCVNFIFLVGNILFTLLSFYMGPAFFGYGFALSLFVSIIVALLFLNKAFNELEYFTFMMTD